MPSEMSLYWCWIEFQYEWHELSSIWRAGPNFFNLVDQPSPALVQSSRCLLSGRLVGVIKGIVREGLPSLTLHFWHSGQKHCSFLMASQPRRIQNFLLNSANNLFAPGCFRSCSACQISHLVMGCIGSSTTGCITSASKSWQHLRWPPTLMSWRDLSNSGARVTRRLDEWTGFSVVKHWISSGKLFQENKFSLFVVLCSQFITS